MNKRILKTLAKTGHFNSANAAFYAATRNALRGPLNANYFQAADASEPETLSQSKANIAERSDARQIHHPRP